MNKRKENDVVRSICTYLQMKRYFFWRQNNVGIWDAVKKVYRKSYHGMKGVPDIFCIKDGKFYAIECKIKTGKQSKDQQVYEYELTKNGGIYILAYGLNEIINKGL